ncbi:DUF4625 domain-containing protein [Pedobacter sp. SYP-B3415]|uniref:DUF4625 domain-containing protein n=1 Tax=Pedobacter sp. SYP-B3415 TaxID=2496641 RepID=UPI00101CAD55|nr:DUF4625 domain-containing protein [Pedobacter sp. SYP-B3415]
MKSIKSTILFLLFLSTFTACKKDAEEQIQPETPRPKMDNLELGLGNAGIGVTGEDFHFEADLVAVEKLDKVEVKMIQRPGETYSKSWTHEIIWTQYKGLKNTNVHKHFKIPAEAAEGKYDLVVAVYDENGSKLEVKRDFEIFSRANLPVRPMFTGIYVHRNWTPFYDSHADKDVYPSQRLKMGDTLQTQVNVSFVKGDGKLYALLIKKSANYNPKTIEEVDLSKAIVYDVFEHKNEPAVYDFSNSVFDFNTFMPVRLIPDLIIGAARDNNTGGGNPINGTKSWQAGDYNLVIIYKNMTANKTIYRSIPFGIE